VPVRSDPHALQEEVVVAVQHQLVGYPRHPGTRQQMFFLSLCQWPDSNPPPWGFEFESESIGSNDYVLIYCKFKCHLRLVHTRFRLLRHNISIEKFLSFQNAIVSSSTYYSLLSCQHKHHLRLVHTSFNLFRVHTHSFNRKIPFSSNCHFH
jgi:hypothetical protein